MRMTDIIEHKKQGLKLTKEEIEFFVRGYTKGDIPDYQAAALAMAVYFNKMDNEETADLTLAMAHSGDMLDLSEFGNSTVDKHSSGGVGDKTTLIVAPIACAAALIFLFFICSLISLTSSNVAPPVENPVDVLI